MVNVSRAAKISTFKNHPTDILHSENHLYRIYVLVHIIHKTALNTTKHLQVAGYKIFKNRQKFQFLSHCLTHCFTHCLTTVTSLEHKRSSAQSPFYATTTNSPVGCAFWGSNECMPCAPCLSFYLQSGWLSSSSIETIPMC